MRYGLKTTLNVFIMETFALHLHGRKMYTSFNKSADKDIAKLLWLYSLSDNKVKLVKESDKMHYWNDMEYWIIKSLPCTNIGMMGRKHKITFWNDKQKIKNNREQKLQTLNQISHGCTQNNAIR